MAAAVVKAVGLGFYLANLAIFYFTTGFWQLLIALNLNSGFRFWRKAKHAVTRR